MEKMKLSDAIELGAELRPKTKGCYFGPAVGPQQDKIGSCALGAAYEAITGATM